MYDPPYSVNAIEDRKDIENNQQAMHDTAASVHDMGSSYTAASAAQEDDQVDIAGAGAVDSQAE